MNHVETIHGFIVENFLFGDGGQLTNETSFLDSGIIDSTGILELITFLEETYNITIADDELTPENLDSLNNVAKFIKQKIPCAE
ncbi:MAG: acyl carrier protein [Planctomycetes bacterium]|nr:acyl carrier protein [Planctomycetota bacterium]